MNNKKSSLKQNLIENEITSSLTTIKTRALADKNNGRGWSDTKWTSEIKNSLVEKGHTLGYEVSCSGCNDADCGEWLYDLAWYKYDKNRILKSLALAVESEWGSYDEIKYDFEKILVSKAEYKLLIFQGNEINSYIENLIDIINSYEGSEKGDSYLFTGWHWDEQNFIFYNYIF